MDDQMKLSDDPKQAAAEAIYSFAGWLTSRRERSGPFSAADDAASMAELVHRFCEANGWEPHSQWPGYAYVNPDSSSTVSK